MMAGGRGRGTAVPTTPAPPRPRGTTLVAARLLSSDATVPPVRETAALVATTPPGIELARGVTLPRFEPPLFELDPDVDRLGLDDDDDGPLDDGPLRLPESPPPELFDPPPDPTVVLPPDELLPPELVAVVRGTACAASPTGAASARPTASVE